MATLAIWFHESPFVDPMIGRLSMPVDQLRYAGFWPRIGSLILDLFILFPVALILNWGQHRYRLFDVYALAPCVLLWLWFSVYLVSRFGGTPGKLILGLRIIKVTGEPVPIGAAFIRYLPSFVLDTLWRVGLVVVLLHMTDAEYFALPQHGHYHDLMKITPPSCRWAYVGLQVWAWSELVVLLTNEKRRALHDFIAGTIVVHKSPNQPLHATAG